MLKVKKVSVQERVNGTMRITSGNTVLGYHEITGRPERSWQSSTHRPQIRKHKIPSKNHPWRKPLKSQRHPLRDASENSTQ
jgi:hypothetical protein